MRFRALLTAGLLALTTCGTVAAGSVTSPAVANCGNGYSYEVTGHSSKFLAAPGIHYHDGPGGTMHVSVEKKTEVSMSVTASVEVSFSDLLSSVKGSVSTSAERSDGIGIGHDYTHKVPKHKYGNLEYGSYGFYVHFQKVRTTAPCKVKVVGHGTAKLPTDAEGWHYWSTKD